MIRCCTKTRSITDDGVDEIDECDAEAVAVMKCADGWWGVPQCMRCACEYVRMMYDRFGLIIKTARIGAPGIVLGPQPTDDD